MNCNRLFRVASIVAGLASQVPFCHAAASGVETPCSGAEYRQLDFWLGDWDVFDSDAPQGAAIARARIERIAGACAIHELYEQGDGLIGDSILSRDAVSRQWQQTWVTNRGSLMAITGNFEGGVLVLEGDVHAGTGETVRQRIAWQTRGDEVREWALVSKDGGKTWSPAFDVVFRRRVTPRDGAS